MLEKLPGEDWDKYITFVEPVYRPSPHVMEDEQEGFDIEGNWHFLYVPPNIILGEE